MGGKQTHIINANSIQIEKWHSLNMPTDWIAKQLNVSRSKLKEIYPHYTGARGRSKLDIDKINQYYTEPQNCLLCNVILTYKQFISNNKYCSHSCCAIVSNKKRDKISLIGKVNKQAKCKHCKTELLVNSHANITNVTCTECKKYKKYKNRAKSTRACKICNNTFDSIAATMCDQCRKINRIDTARKNLNCGGETNYKRYIYKNILMDSSWEVNIAKWMDNNGIAWERNKKLCLWWTDTLGNRRRYHPDFYIPSLNIYIDTKNSYLMIKDEFKIRKVIEENKITLFVGNVSYIIKCIKNFTGH